MRIFMIPSLVLVGSVWAQENKKPAAQFVQKDIEGWTVHLSKEGTVGKHKPFTDRAIEHLSHQLFQIKVSLPAHAVADLQQVPIWLGTTDKSGGLAFHPSAKWLQDRGHATPPGVRSLIGINNPQNYLLSAVRQPWLAYHELVHGYDFFKLGNKRGYGIDAEIYKKAMATGKYEKALHWNGRYRKPYHATNRMEFFAESSEAFFGTNDIYPFVRAQQRAHDPATHEALAKVWGVDLAQEVKKDAALVKLQATAPCITGLDGREPARAAASNAFAPTDAYRTESIEGWQVKVSGKLWADAKAHWPRTRRLLARDLHYVKRYMPLSAIPKLQKVIVWVEDESRHVPYVAFHHSPMWLASHGLNPDKAGAVEIGSADAYWDYFNRQQSVMVRVLAAGYFKSLSDESRKAIAEARVRCAGMELYQSVLRFDGQKVKHPALANDHLFFARMSEALFGTSDHYPFLRYELKEKDKATFDLLARLWGGGPPPMKR